MRTFISEVKFSVLDKSIILRAVHKCVQIYNVSNAYYKAADPDP